MSDKFDYKLSKLTKDNYVTWKWQFKNILRAKKLDKVLIDGNFQADMDAQALALLGSALDEENMLKIINCETFGNAWNAIEVCFENKTAYEPQNLFRRLNSFKMNSASEVSQGVSELKGIVAQLKNLKENVSDNNLIGAILSALPSSFDIFVTVWKNSMDQSVDSLVSKLMAEATDQIAKDIMETQALAARSNVRRGNNGNRNNLDKDQCRYCREKGHWIKDCNKLKTPYDANYSKKRSNKDKKSVKNDNCKDSNDSDECAFMTKVSNVRLPEDTWVADTGCTYHMTPYKWLFSSFTSSSNIGSIQMADEDTCLKVAGQGEVTTEQGKLKQVLYVPGLSQNLFSVSTATMNGLTHAGSKDRITFYHKGAKKFEAHLKNRLFLIKFTPKNPLLAHVKSATLNEWHSRFNHVSQDTIKIMKKSKVVDGLEIATNNEEKCVSCQMNKCTHANHPMKTTKKAAKAGNVLHIDTSGKSNVQSIGGSQYFVLCKDEASGYRMIAFVATKDQITDTVKAFISRATLETGNQVLKIVSDNGTEFTNTNLQDFLKSRGIIHDKSVAHVPQQNGYVEREMRTHKEAAKAMLSHSKLNKNLWAEAVNCATYTLNRVVSQSNVTATPYELWFGVKPNVKNLRVFGEVAIIKKQKSQVEGSWDEKGESAIFVGYTNRFNTYRFLKDGKIFVACDAVFLNKMHDEKQPLEPRENESIWISCDPSEYVLMDNDVSYGSSLDESIEQPTDQNFSMAQEGYSEPRTSTPSRQNLESTLNADHSVSVSEQNQSDNAEQGTIEGHLQVAPSERPISHHFNTDVDMSFTLTRGNKVEHFRLSDLEYRPNANNWINTKTGLFVGKNNIEIIKGKVNRHQNQRANVTKVRTIELYEDKVPQNYEEAMSSSNRASWKNAMDDEMKSLDYNEVYEVISRNQVNKKIVSSKWVYTVKYKKNGDIDKFKARIVARGFTQVYGEDYGATYCSVVQVMTTRFTLAYAAMNNLKIRQFDVKTAFLNGELNEEIYMEPADGYGEPDQVWKLKRSIYGLKQSPRMWNEKFTSFMTSLNFNISNYDNSVFYRLNPTVIIIIYVDDGLIFAPNEKDINDIMEKLQERFEIRVMDVGLYRGLEIEIEKDGIMIHQSSMIKKILATFNMTNAKPAKNPMIKLDEQEEHALRPSVPYRSAIGMLQYLSDFSRPDIAYAVNKLARKMACPTETDWKLVKHLLRYLVGSKSMGIKFSNQGRGELVAYSDSDFAGDYESAKSTTGYIIVFNGAPIHWKSQLQRHVTVSSTESEVVALCTLSKELSWIRRMALELNIIRDTPVVIQCDNKSALMIVKSERLAGRTRHLRAQNAYIHEQVEYGELILNHVKTEYNLADLLTKVVQTGKFENNRKSLLQQVDSHHVGDVKETVCDVNLCTATGIDTPTSQPNHDFRLPDSEHVYSVVMPYKRHRAC